MVLHNRIDLDNILAEQGQSTWWPTLSAIPHKWVLWNRNPVAQDREQVIWLHPISPTIPDLGDWFSSLFSWTLQGTRSLIIGLINMGFAILVILLIAYIMVKCAWRCDKTISTSLWSCRPKGQSQRLENISKWMYIICSPLILTPYDISLRQKVAPKSTSLIGSCDLFHDYLPCK